MTRSSRAVLVVGLMMAGLAVSASRALSQSDLDKRMRADYQALERAQEAMGGEMTSDQREQQIEVYLKACRDYIAKYGNETGGMTTGHFDLARAYIGALDPTSAQQHLEQFVRTQAPPAEVEEGLLMLGDVYRQTNMLAKAISLYEDFLAQRSSSDKVPHAMSGLAISHFLGLEFDAAVSTFEELIAKYPEHEVGVDAAVQITDAYVYAGKYDKARRNVQALLAKSADAPALRQQLERVEMLGRPAPELTGVLEWVGVPGSSIARMRGRVLVLCFFMTRSIPSARSLQALSSIERDLEPQGLTVWGLTKAYKIGKKGWTLENEVDWLERYRKEPRYVVQREIAYQPGESTEEEKEIWEPLAAPISVTLGLTKDFTNHKAYKVRGVPAVALIDKKGMIRLLEKGGQPEGGFQWRALRLLIRRLAAE